MLDQKQIERIRKSDYESLIVRKEYLQKVLIVLDEIGSYHYNGHNLYDTKKELDYILDVLAFDFTPKR